MVDLQRVRTLKVGADTKGPIIYWMSRDQRSTNNWALLYAQELALELKQPLYVLFCLTPDYLDARAYHYNFMIKGLEETAENLSKHNIGFALFKGKPEQIVPSFCQSLGCGILVCDFSPLRISRTWKDSIASKISCSFHEVDAHNIVPCWLASPKLEYAAYTFRPKIKRLLGFFLTSFPVLKLHPFGPKEKQHLNVGWPQLIVPVSSKKDQPGRANTFNPGEQAGEKTIEHFIRNKLARYDIDRNDPTKKGQSELSPYLHFGQISAQWLALTVRDSEMPGIHPDSYLEELIVRRELSDNYCFYNQRYDQMETFPRWARSTLDEHREDPREQIYSPGEFERAGTADPLWNAAQMEMILTGKMHGYMRMYWAKKILEWSENPEEALKIAINLNDRYSLDGRDPNGYAGIAWSIGGVHDRAWPERPIYGKVRYMSYSGSKRKFDVIAYINSINTLEKNY